MVEEGAVGTGWARELCVCGGEITSADVEARECTTCRRPIVLPTRMEKALAALSIALLRDGGVPDDEILADYTGSKPRADRAYEQQILRECGVAVQARCVKVQMKRMLTH